MRPVVNRRQALVKNKVALYQKRMNNPPSLIGYLDLDTRDIYTARGNHSTPTTYDHNGNIRDNWAHRRRSMAAASPDYTVHVKRAEVEENGESNTEDE